MSTRFARLSTRLRNTDCALVIVDLQFDYCHPDGVFGRSKDRRMIDTMVANVGELHRRAEQCSVPVIFLRNGHTAATDSDTWLDRPGAAAACREGSVGATPYGVAPAERDIVVTKHRYSGFIGTRLEQVLRALGRETLVFCGVATNVCVESTARHAYMLDYGVVVVEDATAAEADAHRASLENIRRHFGLVLPTTAVVDGWRRPRAGEAQAVDTPTSEAVG